MPSFETYRKLHNGTIGQEHKRQSDAVMNATWWNDIAARTVYLFDYWHDTDKTRLDDFNPENIPSAEAVDAKFIEHSSQTYGDDQNTFHLQLRPGFKCEGDRFCNYNKVFKEYYDATFPIGLYALIPDEQGIYNRWLVVQRADYNSTQFPTFEVLRCDKIIQYVNKDRKCINVAGVVQNQNSYNSGIWSGQKTTIVEDQIKFAVPLNRETENLYYNQRLILDNKVLTEPRTWHVSKVNRIMPNGIAIITLAQTKFNPDTDYVDINKNGEVIGMWADYFVGNATPIIPTEVSDIHAEITYSGQPTMRVGSGFKKFAVNFYKEDQSIDLIKGQWQYFIGDEDVSSLITYSTVEVNSNEVKIKFDSKDQAYGGKVLTIKYVTNDGIIASTDINLANL